MPQTEKTWKRIAGLCLALLIIALISAWWYVQSVQNKYEGASPITPSQPSQPVSDLWFDPSTIVVGDRVGGWTVAGIDFSEPGVPRSVRFSGSAQVSGAFTYYGEDAPFYANEVFFKTDAAGAAVLPRPVDRPLVDGDGRFYRAFVFSDDDAVRRVFGVPGNAGSATVWVKDYEVTLMGGEAIDTARLVRMI